MKDLLLDTCALIWIAVSPERLSKSALRKIEQAPTLYASAVSAWEIAFKWRTGKLILPVPPEEFVGRVKGKYGTVAFRVSLLRPQRVRLRGSPCVRAGARPSRCGHRAGVTLPFAKMAAAPVGHAAGGMVY